MGKIVLNDNDNTIVKTVCNGGSSGIIYVPKIYIGFDVKVIIPGVDGSVDEILSKNVGRHKFCGKIYVHKRNLGRTVKVKIPQITQAEGDMSAG